MGKGEEGSEESTDDENTSAEQETTEEEVKPEETKTEEYPEKKKKADELRKVIKVNKDDSTENAEGDNLDSDSREGLEQKRAILQSIKDFDFQIKKNQEEITTVNQKLDSVSKDLDDLVSLYEIVSEQMNPFVGLSKVTKKRIDALENFTREIDDLKNRMGDIESFAVRTGADLKTISKERQGNEETESIDQKIEKQIKNDEKEAKPEETKTEEQPMEQPPENQPVQEPTPEQAQPQQQPAPTVQEQAPPQIEQPKLKVQQPVQPMEQAQQIQPQITQSQPLSTPDFQMPTKSNVAGPDALDKIIEKSLRMLSIDSEIDRTIDEFIENLLA